MSHTHIFPDRDAMLSRESKEKLLHQNGHCLWFTGLSGSGKTTLARRLEDRLFMEGRITMLLDGDIIRNGLNNNLGFSEEDRTENIRRIAEVARLFVQSGIITLCSFVSPTIAIREMAAEIIGKEDFSLIYVDTALEVCETRDVKGLYQKARKGEIKSFTGIDAPYDVPVMPHLKVSGASPDIEGQTNKLYNYLANLNS